MDPVEIAAGRLHLRPWTPYDADEVFAACQDPDIQHWTTVPSPYTYEDARRFLTQADWSDGVASWAVRDATTGAVLASVALGAGDGGSIGYWCLAEARGTGVMSEAVQTVCRFAFGALGRTRITWTAEVGNLASRAVAQKCGFTIEGQVREGLRHRGRSVDAWFGSLLATDPMTDTRPLPSPPTLTDGVVTLRPWSVADAEDCARACNDPETVRWLPVPSPYTLADAEGYISGYIAGSWADGTAAELAVTDATTGELLGAMGLKLHQRRLGFGEIGYWTAPWARGRGVAGRGAALSARWGLDVLGLNRVELLADVDNLPSQQAAEKGGFVREGVLRQARFLRDGEARDMVVFSVVPADLEAAAQPG